MTNDERAKLEKEHQHLREIKGQHRASLFSLPNVVGVGVGYKVTKGERTDQLSVRVYVTEKKPLSMLRIRERIPVQVKGVPTDVIQMGKIIPLQHITRERPAKGGASIGTLGSDGTLGGVFADDTDDTWVILSCNHVIALADDVRRNLDIAGLKVIQPGTSYGGDPEHDAIASLKRWVKFVIAAG